MICQDCKKEYKKWLPEKAYKNNRCLECNQKRWEEWEIAEAENIKRIRELQAKGHPHHCACRQVWGDGECECDLYEMGYDPYGWTKGKRIFVPEPPQGIKK